MVERAVASQRVVYQNQQVLTAADLNDEQTYLQSLRRRHYAAAHGLGVVTGLGLSIAKSSKLLVIAPGVALDGYGRELVLRNSINLDFAQLNKFGHDSQGRLYLTFWLSYRILHEEDNTHGPGDCTPRRVLERPALQIRKISFETVAKFMAERARPEDILDFDNATPCLWPFLRPIAQLESDTSFFNPRQTANLSASQRRFTPVDDPPADVIEDPNNFGDLPCGSLRWPVYLGLVYDDPKFPDPDDPSATFRVETPAKRRFTVGVTPVGESIRSASSYLPPDDPANPPSPTPVKPVPRAELLLGGISSGTRQHFAVRLPDVKGLPVERLSIDQPGDLAIHGSTTLGLAEQDKNDLAKSPDLNFITGLAVIKELQKGDQTTRVAPQRVQTPVAQQTIIGQGVIDRISWQVPELRARMSFPVSETAPENLPTRVNAAGLGTEIEEPQPIPPIPPVVRPSFPGLNLDPVLLSKLTGPLLWDFAKMSRYPIRLSTYKLIQSRPTGLELFRANWQILQDLDPCHALPDLPAGEAVGLHFQAPKAPTKAAAPWRYYFVEFKDEVSGKKIRQLRIEIAAIPDGANPDQHQFAIGRRAPSDQAPFEACLTVNAACTVVMKGDLQVGGQVVKAPPGAEPGDTSSQPATLDAAQQAINDAKLAYASLKVGFSSDVVVTQSTTHYTLDVQNIGPDTLNNFQIVDTHNNMGTNPDIDTQIILKSQAIAPGGSTTLTVDYVNFQKYTEGRPIRFALTLIGLRTGAPSAYADAKLEVTIQKDS
jgi:hypothetical protein